MKRLILLAALVMAMAVLAPAAFADDSDTDEIEGSDVEMEEKEPSVAQLFKAEMIADYVAPDGTTAEEIMALRSGPPAIGWGVLFKLQAYAAAGMDLGEFLTDDGGYALGLIRKAYLEGDYAPLGYKNLGQLQKDSKDKPEKPEKPEKDMPPRSNKDKHKHDG